VESVISIRASGRCPRCEKKFHDKHPAAVCERGSDMVLGLLCNKCGYEFTVTGDGLSPISDGVFSGELGE